MKLLDIGEVANSFFLFKVPRVKEILGISLKNFKQDNTVVVEDVPYLDKNKEKQKEGVIKKRLEKKEEKDQQRKELEDKPPMVKRNFSKSQKKRKR